MWVQSCDVLTEVEADCLWVILVVLKCLQIGSVQRF